MGLPQNRGGVDVVSLVEKARTGDTAAYDRLVYRYQDMAVAYAVSLLHNADFAQDAALAAFVQAYRDLHTLRIPAAFARWLRRIIFKQCDRILRIKRVPVVSLESVGETASLGETPEQAVLRREAGDALFRAIQSLPPGERAVTLLFYQGEHSYDDISVFLEIPQPTVKSRLFSARKRLKERLGPMTLNNLQGEYPSENNDFSNRVREAVEKAAAEIAAGNPNEALVRNQHPAARYRDPHPVFKLTNTLIQTALARGAHRIRLTPQKNGLSVQLIADKTTIKRLTLPEALREPIIARFKDGAGMNPENTTSEQAGVTPVYDPRNERLYDMHVKSSSATRGEKIELELVRVTAAP